MTITDPNLVNTYPHMYDNQLCKLLMSSRNTIELFSILKYYDMFTHRGHWNWVVDLFSIVFLWPWEFIKLIIREDSGDWNYGT